MKRYGQVTSKGNGSEVKDERSFKCSYDRCESQCLSAVTNCATSLAIEIAKFLVSGSSFGDGHGSTGSVETPIVEGGVMKFCHSK